MKYTQLLYLAILLNPTLTFADELRSTRGQGLIERSHHVDVSLKEGIATLRVRRSFYNPGTQHEQAELSLHLPRGAAATGLRIKAGKKWYEGELMEAQKAADLYEELTGIGPHAARDPALLSWSWVDELFLSVFPIAPKHTSFVEYTLTMPTSYFEGNYLLSYPRAGKKTKNEELNQLAVPTISFHGLSNVKIDDKKVRKRRTKLADVERKEILNELEYETEYRYAVLPLKIREEHRGKRVKINIKIDHTWVGDVGIDLVDPLGNIFSIDSGDWQGESENKKTIEHILKKSVSTKGTWHLIAWDTFPRLDSGQITRWSLEFGEGKTASIAKYTKPTPVPNSANVSIATISIPTKIKNKLEFNYSKVDIIKDKHFLSYEINLAKKLSRLPKKLHLSFLVDASHSMTEQKTESVRRLMREILLLVPRAKVDMVLFDRHPHLYGKKTWRAKDLFKKLNSLTIQGHNGSNLDEALSFTETRSKPQKGLTHETIILTDGRFRPSWNTQNVVDSLVKKKKAPLHVIVFDSSEPDMIRDDGSPLFPLAKKRGGVALYAGDLAAYRTSKLKEKALYLLRPTSIENASVNKEKIEDLVEGSGIRSTTSNPSSPDFYSFYGELWSTPIRRKSYANTTQSKALAAFVFSLDMYSELTDKEQLKLAMYANVVSPVTSFLAVEPGLRPSTIGFERSEFGAGGMGMAGMGRGGGGYVRTRPEIEDYLSAAIDSCRPLMTSEQTILLDTTSQEIVGIRPQTHQNKKATTCLVEAFWNTNLPLGYWYPEHTWTVLIPGK